MIDKKTIKLQMYIYQWKGIIIWITKNIFQQLTSFSFLYFFLLSFFLSFLSRYLVSISFFLSFLPSVYSRLHIYIYIYIYSLKPFLPPPLSLSLSLGFSYNYLIILRITWVAQIYLMWGWDATLVHIIAKF